MEQNYFGKKILLSLDLLMQIKSIILQSTKINIKTRGTNLKMPEINFQINLPDGKKASLYSPSTVILEYLKPGDSLKISDFKSLAIQALHKASEKVRAKYGFACTRTLEEEEKILSWISNYDPDQLISISKE